MFDFTDFRAKWDLCFEVPEEKRREILSLMSEEELNHFLSPGERISFSREQKIEEHLEHFARETGELEDSEEMDF